LRKNFMGATEPTEYINLQQYWFILKRRWLPGSAVLGFVLLFTALVTFLQKPVYQAQGELLFKKADTTSSLTGLGKEIGSLDSVQSNPLDTEAEIIRSVAISQNVMTALNLKDKQGVPIKRKEFLKRLEVKSIKGTDVLELSFKSTVPQEAVAVVNQLMNFYLENNIRTNRAEATAARRFIEEQLPKTKDTVRQAEAALRGFKERNKIVALQEEAKSAVTVIADLESRIAKAQVDLTNANTRSAALQNQLGMNSQQATAISSLSQSRGVQKVLEDFQAIESQLEVERSRFQEDAPVIVNLKSKEALLKDLLQKRIKQVLGDQQQSVDGNLQIGELQQRLTSEFVNSEVERLVLTNQIAALANVNFNYKERANVIPQLEQSQRELEREVQAAQATYETLLKKLQEVRITEQQNVGNARIIQAALVPEKPVAPRKLLNFGLGGVVGILLAVITVLVLDARDTSLKTVREVRELLGYTLLGIVPNFEKIDKLGSRNRDLEPGIPKIPVKDDPRSLISETYGMLYANLKFLSSDKEVRVITITSAVPKEGKSTVCANLALAIAQLGFRVLLIDADMRHPSQHTVWELPNSLGLSNVIVEQIQLKTAIAQAMPNLYVLTSGLVPPNPLALLNSRRMASLIEDFSQTYDFVIIDTPPISAAADARILSAMTDGMLMVVQPKLVDSASAIAAKELLEQSGQNILGMVINAVIPENEPDSYFYAKEYNNEKDFITGANARFNITKQAEH
jgi:capsular exopolysaccharide synthesis family protein